MHKLNTRYLLDSFMNTLMRSWSLTSFSGSLVVFGKLSVTEDFEGGVA